MTKYTRTFFKMRISTFDVDPIKNKTAEVIGIKLVWNFPRRFMADQFLNGHVT